MTAYASQTVKPAGKNRDFFAVFRFLPAVAMAAVPSGGRGRGRNGNGTPIDALQIQYTAPGGKKFSVKYRVSPLNGNYYPYQVGTAKTGGMDGYAGVRGKKLDRLQIVLE